MSGKVIENARLYGIRPFVIAAVIATVGGVIVSKSDFTLAVKPLSVVADAKSPEARSVAYFVANLREAKDVNKACISHSELPRQPRENCDNALHALNIAHVGLNYQN